jgi:hypothetical protein
MPPAEIASIARMLISSAERQVEIVDELRALTDWKRP